MQKACAKYTFMKKGIVNIKLEHDDLKLVTQTLV